MISFPVQDPVLTFSIVMLAVLFAPLLAEKLKLPGIVGLIFFGVILGPHVANILERDRTIELLGTIGLLYIMFQAGLEINLEEIKKNRHHSIMFGLLTFLIPLVLGTLAGLYILKMSLPASILLASMFSSHTLLTFPIVSKLGLAKKSSVAATVGGTIITDTLAFLVLAVIIASNTGGLTSTFWIKLLIYSLIYGGLMIFLLPKITAWFFRIFFTESGIEDYVFVITVLFVSAHFSHVIGLEPVIGAFLAGLVLNPLIPEKSVLMNRIQFVGNSLFIPFFLISVGMIIDPMVFLDGFGAIKVSLVMIAAGIISKELAARLFCKVAKFNSTERGLMFGMSVNQAAATLAAVLVGYKVGIFSEEVLTGTIMMIIATCFTGSILTQKYARKYVLETKDSLDFSNKTTLDRVLIPLSNGENVNNLMDFAFILHSKSSHEPLYPLHISLEGSKVERQIVEGEEILTKAGVRANAMQKSVVPLNKIDNNVSSSILKTVKEQRITKILLGWNEKTGNKGSFAGTVTEQLTKYCEEMIFISKIIKPIGTMERIILIIPPFIYKQNGFINTITSIKKLGTEISAEWFIVAEEETYNQIIPHFEKQKGKISYHFVNSWKKIINELGNILKPSDLIMQLLSRRDKIAWRLNFEQLPDNISSKFSQNNMVIVYPYCNTDYGEDNAIESDTEEDGLLGILKPKQVIFNSGETDVTKVIRDLVDSSFKRNSNAIYDNIIGVLDDFPLELTEDIVLIHTRTDLVEDYSISMGINREGFKIDKLDKLNKIVILMFSPSYKTAQGHLNVLSQISRLVTIPNFLENALISQDFDEFKERLKS